MFAAIAVLTTLLFLLHLSSRDENHHMDLENSGGLTNGASWGLSNYWTILLDDFVFSVGQYCISFLYDLYKRFTWISAAMFLLKYVPTGFYMYRLMRSIYVKSRERIRQKQMELEDIQLQIQIMNTKICVRDAEFGERSGMLRRGAERLRAVRARVCDVIAADDELRRLLARAAPAAPEPTDDATPDEEREYLISLLKELKSDEVAIPEKLPECMECGELMTSDPNISDNSIYSSLSDAGAKQDCQVKIVKVTKVYKVAYLKHYIKQKRLRRATRQALLKKKIEGVKKVLEDWQKMLTMVSNSKLSVLDSSSLDVASQEAMGDYSKPNLRESDSDSDPRGNGGDVYFDEYSWPNKSFAYNYEGMSESPVVKELHDAQDFCDNKTQSLMPYPYDCGPREPRILFVLPEETVSQAAIEEVKSEAGEFEAECRDLIAL